jgi:chromosome segregation ATPase
MTFMGRVLIVLHLVLSIVFMAFAGAVYTAQANWRDRFQKTEKSLADLQRKQSDLQTELEKEKTAFAAKEKDLRDQVTTLTGEKTSLLGENTKLATDNKDLKTMFDAERDVARLNTEEANERMKESTLQREKNSELYASRNEVISDLNQLRDKLFAMELQQEEFDRKHSQLLKDNAAMRAFLASKRLTTDPQQMTAVTQPPTDVQGVILDINKPEKGAEQLVEISAGSDDDLREGHRLTVFRGDKYLGVIQITHVSKDISVGRVIKRMPNTSIKVGDNVSTKL